jgi:hypothetical protein
MPEMLAKVLLEDYQTCPRCGGCDGTVGIGQTSIWGYCRTHRLKWLKGYYLLPQPEQQYNAIGLGEFEYVGPDAEDYKVHAIKKAHSR